MLKFQLALSSYLGCTAWRRTVAESFSLPMRLDAACGRTSLLGFTLSLLILAIHLACQDVAPKPLCEFLPEKWNPLNEVPLTQWLLPNIPDGHYRARMKSLGNVVVPQTGDLAMTLLHRMFLETIVVTWTRCHKNVENLANPGAMIESKAQLVWCQPWCNISLTLWWVSSNNFFALICCKPAKWDSHWQMTNQIRLVCVRVSWDSTGFQNGASGLTAEHSCDLIVAFFFKEDKEAQFTSWNFRRLSSLFF